MHVYDQELRSDCVGSLCLLLCPLKQPLHSVGPSSEGLFLINIDLSLVLLLALLALLIPPSRASASTTSPRLWVCSPTPIKMSAAKTKGTHIGGRVSTAALEAALDATVDEAEELKSIAPPALAPSISP